MDVPPLGMPSNGRMDRCEEEAAGPRDMSPPCIIKDGMRRWKGVSLYAPDAQRARKF
jgi:hypothetical protein